MILELLSQQKSTNNMNPFTHQLPRCNVRQGEEDDGHGDVEELVHGSEHHQPVEVANIGFNFSVNYFQSLLCLTFTK